eukprot:GEMP01034025.1.p1 GENE.GEMP01034025.1~~GEMP01034025.1.p1  ORF type:complete len:610 (+),score=125.85 GEMP01034025.1:40-1869(+)
MDDIVCHVCGGSDLQDTDAGFPVCRDCGTALTTYTQEELDGDELMNFANTQSGRAVVRLRKTTLSKTQENEPTWRVTTQIFINRALQALKDLWFSYLHQLVEKNVHLDAESLLQRNSNCKFDPSKTPELYQIHWFWSLDLALLWLACMRAGDPIVPKDIQMWIKDGTIPFHSSFACLNEATGTAEPATRPNFYLRRSFEHRHLEKPCWFAARFKPYFYPSASDILRTASILQLRYDIDLGVDVGMEPLVRRVADELGLPENVRECALRVVMAATVGKHFEAIKDGGEGRSDALREAYPLNFVGGAPPTILAAACVVTALKLSYQRFNLPHEEGLDTWTKALLTRFALPVIRESLLNPDNTGEEFSPEEHRWRYMCMQKNEATIVPAERSEPIVDHHTRREILQRANDMPLKVDGSSDSISLDVWRAVRAEGKTEALMWWLREIAQGLSIPWGTEPPNVRKPPPTTDKVVLLQDSAPTTSYTEFFPDSSCAGYCVLQDLPNPYVAAILGKYDGHGIGEEQKRPAEVQQTTDGSDAACLSAVKARRRRTTTPAARYFWKREQGERTKSVWSPQKKRAEVGGGIGEIRTTGGAELESCARSREREMKAETRA